MFPCASLLTVVTWNPHIAADAGFVRARVRNDHAVRWPPRRVFGDTLDIRIAVNSA